MSKFRYLPGVIPFTFILTFIVAATVATLFQRLIISRRRSETPIYGRNRLNIWQRFFYGYPYEFVYQSSWKGLFGNYISMYLLLVWRICAFLYFFGIVFLWNYIRTNGSNAYFFSLWNINLITSYYFLTVVASLIGVRHHQRYIDHQETLITSSDANPDSYNYWSNSLTQFGYIVQILYEITGSTAFFITFVTFMTLDSGMLFWNLNDHFVTTSSVLVELLLSRLVIRWEHVIFTIIWGLMYLIFIWPMVVLGVLSDWPYHFLKTDTSMVFFWYFALVAFLIFFYIIFVFLGWLKESFILSLETLVNMISHSRPK